MNTIRMWRDESDRRAWAEVVGQGRGHLLALLLHGNLTDTQSCQLALESAKKATLDKEFAEDLGFFDSVALSFSNGHVRLDHAIPAYGSIDIEAQQFQGLLSTWLEVVGSRGPIERFTELKP